MGVVGQHQQAAFVNPQNGQAGDAAVVLGNDNATRGKHNSHDSDGTIHIQTSDLASRPAAGTAGRVWMTTDGQRIYIDDGASWDPLLVRAEDLIPGTATGNFAITGDLSVSGTLTLGALSLTSLAVSGAATIGTTLGVTGATTMSGGATVSGARLQITRASFAVGDYLRCNTYLTFGPTSLTDSEIRHTGAGAQTGFSVFLNRFIGGVDTTVEAMRLEWNLAIGATGVYFDFGGGLTEISLGAVDSGGAGFRLLRIPN